MKRAPDFSTLLAILSVISASAVAHAQNLPGSLGFSISGSFVNGTAESSSSILITDNDLTNGYKSGFDLTDAPAALKTAGPAGSAAFQWGAASPGAAYSHSSALWFKPFSVANIAPEQSFDLGSLFYRNGTIKSNTGASAVDLALTLSFAPSLGIDPVSVVFGSQLINTVNTNDQIASADIVSLENLKAPLNFTDAAGNRYYLELTFKVDQDTIDGTLSTPSQFKVFEGAEGSATLVGRFTTGLGVTQVPEPSAAVIGALGMFFLLRRRR